MEYSIFSTKSACTFLWKIENINYLWLKLHEKIESPEFMVDQLENTGWRLLLYPKGYSSIMDIGFMLWRCQDGSSIHSIVVQFELAFLSENGSTLCCRRSPEHTFKKGSAAGYQSFAIQIDVFVDEKTRYLPFNTLTTRCRIWRCDEKVAVDKYFLAESHVVVQKRSFQWQIEKFSAIEQGEEKNLVIKSVTNEAQMVLHLYLTGGNVCEEAIAILIHILDPNAKYLFFKTSVLNLVGMFRTNCGMKELFLGDCEKKGIFTLSYSKTNIMKKYVTNDVLTLYCECIFSTGIICETIETIDFETAALNTGARVELDTSGLPMDEIENVIRGDAVSFIEDIGSLYKCNEGSDMKLRTASNTIPVHTQILGARSPVFRAMFANDMKETREGCIDVTDLDDDTVKRMLLYMYTDKLEDLQWENASRLYAAADKYDIASLRSKCGAILQAKLSPTNASQILTLADMHQEKVLKKCVQYYISVLGKSVYNSEGWKALMETNLPLAEETMHPNWNAN